MFSDINNKDEFPNSNMPNEKQLLIINEALRARVQILEQRNKGMQESQSIKDHYISQLQLQITTASLQKDKLLNEKVDLKWQVAGVQAQNEMLEKEKQELFHQLAMAQSEINKLQQEKANLLAPDLKRFKGMAAQGPMSSSQEQQLKVELIRKFERTLKELEKNNLSSQNNISSIPSNRNVSKDNLLVVGYNTLSSNVSDKLLNDEDRDLSSLEPLFPEAQCAQTSGIKKRKRGQRTDVE